MISTVRGRFGKVGGTLLLDEANPERSKIEVEVDIASIDTRQEQRDAHLRSADFFDADNHPTMRFVSTKIDGDITGDFTVTGDLTIRGATRPVTLEASAEGRGRDPWGNERMGFAAKGKFLRSDFGLTWNQVLEAGGVTVGDEVKISIDVELIRQAANADAA
jgi:polyisoprenoid-binding protein YceI